MSSVTVRCPFCGNLFQMSRPLFFTEREHTACPTCRDEAKRNMVEMHRKRTQGKSAGEGL